MRSTRTLSSRPLLLGAVLICITLFSGSAHGQVDQGDEGGYGFYRTVVGDVRLTTLERAEPMDVEPDYPLLMGDRLWVSPGGRAEAILPDQTILRAGGGTDLYFEDLALYAGETAGKGTVLRLLEGEIQVVLPESAWVGEPVRVDTVNAVVYLERSGTYRIYADDRQWTELVVREGFGEVVVGDGSVVVRPNEEAVIEGEPEPRVRVYPAGALDALEAWGDELDRDAELAARDNYVDESLSYAAAPLREHGEWLDVDDGHVWRPYATAGWRPYSSGYWTHTPAGYYWVSADPWGGLTSHYGSWSLHSRHGWVWYPGVVFSPAWVTWYWGPTHVGWVPAGYYSHYYRPYGYASVGLGYGHYGWAGGSWGYYNDWTFCPTRYFGWRSYGSYWRTGADIGRTARYDVPRGVITGTTRGVPRGFNDRPESLIEHLRRGDRSAAPNSKLPDVTGFVARQPRLSDDVRDAVFAKPGSGRSVIDRVRTSEPVRPSSPRITAIDREVTRDRPESAIHSLPVRPDLSRREIVTGEPVAREPMQRVPRGVEAPPASRITTPERSGDSDRRSPSSYISGREPVRVSPGSDSRPSSPGSTIRTLPPRAEESRPSPGSSVRPVPPSAREVAPSPSGASPSSGSRVPIVRRILDGIRGVPSSPQSATPPSSAASPTPSTSSRPSSPPPSTSSRPSSPPPTASRPSSGSSSGSVRKPVSSARPSASSSSSSRSSAKPSQSPPKSKPPR